MSKKQVALFWSGGKDSALAFQALQLDHSIAEIALTTSVVSSTQTISMHGVPIELVRQQAKAMGIVLHELYFPAFPSNLIYEQTIQYHLLNQIEQGFTHVAFGDLYLSDIRAYREKLVGRTSLQILFPLWNCDTRQLAKRFVVDRFRAVACCVDTQQLSASFCGREMDDGFFESLPDHVDPCGENGEFHSFVFDAPFFQNPIAFSTHGIDGETRFTYLKLAPIRNEH